jgi:pimeloyl-ACP methyl ester carboxylesterase
VLLNHGWQFFGEDGGLDPLAQYLASQGYYIVYPDLDQSTISPLPDWASQGRSAIAAALAELAGRGVAITRLAVAGHSIGALAAIRVAATWTGTPRIAAALLAEPAGIRYIPSGPGPWDISASGLAGIDASMYLLVIQAQSSVADANSAAVPIWNAVSQIPKTNGAGLFQKNFLRVPDDSSHFWYSPAWNMSLQSQHNSISALPLTAMDYWSYWNPIFNGVYEAFNGVPYFANSAYCNIAGSACTATRFTGTWVLDGAAATPMQNAADLGF